MKATTVVAIVLCLYLCACKEKTSDLIYEKLREMLVDRLYGKGQVDFLSASCQYSTRPVFKKWKLFFIGKFSCPGFAPFSGSSETQSPSGAVEHATKDFIQKALANNLTTEEDVKIWVIKNNKSIKKSF